MRHWVFSSQNSLKKPPLDNFFHHKVPKVTAVRGASLCQALDEYLWTSSPSCFKEPKSANNLKMVGIPLQLVGWIICTILQVKYLYFSGELAIGSPKKSRSLQHGLFDSSALEASCAKKNPKSFCASLSPCLERQVVPMGSCCATCLEGLLRYRDWCGVARLPGQWGGNNCFVIVEQCFSCFFFCQETKEMTCQSRQKAEKLKAIHQAVHQSRIQLCFPNFPCYCSSVALLQKGW